MPSEFELVRRSQRSGRLGEEWCRDTFGIVEDDEYEIKSSSWQSYQFVARAYQLFNSFGKHYVIVRYKRATRSLLRGKRKGRPIYLETIEQAYTGHLDVFAIRGSEIVNIIVRNNLLMRRTLFRRDGQWAAYYCIRSRYWPTTVLAETDRYTLYGDPLDPPKWTREEEALF